jgi:mannose-6-phosphate isomerase class I
VTVVESPFFRTVLHQLRGEAVELNTERRVFHALTCIRGAAQITAGDHAPLALDMGRTAFIPAVLGGYSLTGTAKVLRSYQHA